MRHDALLPSQLHHVAYLVDDLEPAIHNAVETFGAGPFFVLRNVPLQTIAEGEQVDFEHSAAFGQWGPLVMELMQIDRYGSAQLASAMNRRSPTVGHLAWAVPALDATMSQLDRADIPLLMRARTGDIEFAIYDGRPQFGHQLEIHADSDGFRAFFEQVRQASVGWDGTEPIRDPN
jgi:hypothetical protein